jgi:glutathione S-transferase
MRARLALAATCTSVELREVVLREKPEEMLAASPKGTVPVLVLDDKRVIEESRDIMQWALEYKDREGWLAFTEAQLLQMNALVDESDGPFKAALDAYKYASRDATIDTTQERAIGADFMKKLDGMLEGQAYLFGDRFSFCDGAILPFVRQFAHVDREWFWGQDWSNTVRWLEEFLESDRFKAIMSKYPQWKTGEEGVAFGKI